MTKANATHEISINLTKSNLAKIRKSDAFQVSAHNLQEGSHYYLSLSNAVFKKYMKAYKANKGMRFTDYRYLEIGPGDDEEDSDEEDYSGGSLKSIQKAIIKKGKAVKKGAKAIVSKNVNIMLDRGEKVANRQINSIEKAVEQELDHLQKFTDDKTDQVIQGVEKKINKKVAQIGSRIQQQSDMTQKQINDHLKKTFDEDIDTILDEELDGGRIKWKKLGKRIKQSARDASKRASSAAKKAVVKEVTKQVNDVKQKGKRYLAREAVNLGAKVIGTAANYVVPGSGEIVEEASKVGIKQAVKSYPHLMAEKLRIFGESVYFEIPTKSPRYVTDYEFKMKRSDSTVYLGVPFGIYKVKIQSRLPSFNKWFAFNHKTHMYTHYELNFLMENYKELRLTLTNLYDCIIYDETVSGNTLFEQWFYRSLELKNELKGNMLVKKLSSSVWGHLSEKNCRWYTDEELDAHKEISVSGLYNDILPHHTHYMCDETIKHNESSIYKLQDIKQPYKHQFRIKPWVTSLQRVQIYMIIMHIGFSKVCRYHTDSVSFYNEMLTDEDKIKLTQISSTFIGEEKTTGWLWYDCGRFHND